MPSISLMAPPLAGPKSVPSIPDVIGAVNGEQWTRRWWHVHALLDVATSNNATPTDLSGSGVYAKEAVGVARTHYNVVNAWQANYVRGICELDGSLVRASEQCYSDEALFDDFHSARPGATVLDVGCNTGKNMTRAQIYGGRLTDVYGLEYSPDSVAVARKVHGTQRVFQGDASVNFVDEHSWRGKFSVVQCTAVVQHMMPEQVESMLGHISRSLSPGGELLLTFKDAPTRDQMADWGMDQWANEVVTADVARDMYLCDGFLRTVMWDDDYYPGVTSGTPPNERDLTIAGLHRREFVFYSLAWMKHAAAKHGLRPELVEVHPDSKVPLSALHWMVVFRSL